VIGTASPGDPRILHDPGLPFLDDEEGARVGSFGEQPWSTGRLRIVCSLALEAFG
jgi:hypothetical protein